MYKYFILKAAIFLSLIFSSTDYYFYNPNIEYGSESYFHPINTVLNGSFDILRNGKLKNSNNNIKNIQYINSIDNIWYNITHPVENVKKYGVNNFLKLEFFNLTFDYNKGQFFPNIANHVLGNGMLYVKMGEWYDHHNFHHPRLMSLGATTLYQVMNEVVEHPTGQRYVNIDSIADLLIFNPLGIILFSFENVKYFFSKTLPIQDWSLQPMYDPLTHRLENTGQNYIMHFPFLGNNRIQPFVYWGIHGLIGCTYNMQNNTNVSFGIGGIASDIRDEIRELNSLENTIFFFPNMDGAATLAISKNNSLLTQVMLTGPKIYNAQVNIYPGIIKLGKFSPGFYFAIGESEGVTLGVSFNPLPFGFGFGFFNNLL